MIKFQQWLIESIIDKLKINHYQTKERINVYQGKKIVNRVTVPSMVFNAYVGEEFVGDLYLVYHTNGEWVPHGVQVVPDFRRQGVATALYNYAEKVLNIKIKPSSSQTDDGAEFWKSRNQKG